MAMAEACLNFEPWAIDAACQDIAVDGEAYWPTVAEMQAAIRRQIDKVTPKPEPAGRPLLILENDIEEFVMNTSAGQRAIGIGCAATLIIRAQKFCKAGATEEQLSGWLNALTESFWGFQAKTAAECRALAADNTNDPLSSKIWGMMTKREDYLQGEYAR